MLQPGIVAIRLAEAMANSDLIFIAADEQRAETVADLLARALPDSCVIHAPSSDALPGEEAPATPANAGRRVAALRKLRIQQSAATRPTVAFITTAEASARLYPAPAAFDAAPPILAAGDKIELSALEAELLDIGYVADDRVDEPGEIAVRGQVVDIFPADAGQPARIEIQDGRIRLIRRYDPISQRGEEELERLEVGRASEPAAEASATILEHLPGAALALDAEIDRRRARYVALVRDAIRDDGKAARQLCDDARWRAIVGERRSIDVVEPRETELARFVEGRLPLRAFSRQVKPHLENGGQIVLAGAPRDLRFLAPRVRRALGQELVTVGSWDAIRRLPAGTVAMVELPIEHGWQDEGLLVVAAADLLGGRAFTSASGTAATNPFVEGMGELRRGDVVVHEDHGIAVVAGIEPMKAAEGADMGDAIRLLHADEAGRLIPAIEAERLWRYGSDADAVTLDRLDGSSWSKRRAGIDAAIAESATALAALAAERAQRRIPSIEFDAAAYERFSTRFPFTETTDQARAIDAVRSDLSGERPMDRLVVGDVGYGKTEVALRAAAMAAFGRRQVVLAAPTTLLVRQHLETFAKRFEGTGIVVAGLSRLSTAAEKRAVKEGLADGSIDIVIGTGAVAAKGVSYARLGLVIIDEEQRFGSADKMRLRGLGDTHVLTLSATPIPRTLQMALIGLQELSLITTPPARRQPIRTSVASFEPSLIRVALMREKARGGQSFIVVPRIEDMPAMAERLAKVTPELTVVEAHGKMPTIEMDTAMVAFAAGRGDVLLATNIIEAGLDVPRANTMIVWRADRFGLAQLHQLRGRVGRGGRRGQVLLLTDPDTSIAEATLKRLRTLQAFDRLGAGFAISARDLDLRGAGDLLGDAQAGHVKLIGIDLYQHLLGDALRRVRGEIVEHWSPELQLGISGRLPEDWIPDEDIRIGLYARLARIDIPAGIDRFEEELEDRFGVLPDAAQLLLAIARIRLLARAAEIARIVAGPAALALEPRPGANSDWQQFGFEQQRDRYLLREAIDDPLERLARLQALLEDMTD